MYDSFLQTEVSPDAQEVCAVAEVDTVRLKMNSGLGV